MITNTSATPLRPPSSLVPSFSFIDSVAPFVIGGISGALATCLIQPIDTFKVQIQVTSEKLGRTTPHPSLPTLLKQIKNEKGFKVLYTGLDSAILRQLFYGSARLGSYNWTVQYCKDRNKTLNQSEKVLLAIASGASGALVGNPFDVALVRKQASINKEGQKPYKNTFEAFTRIIRQEGVLGLWTGIKITVLRVALINVGQLASKEILADQFDKHFTIPKVYKDNIVETVASVLTSLISLPADKIKVKIQKQHKKNTLYSGTWDCLIKKVEREVPCDNCTFTHSQQSDGGSTFGSLKSAWTFLMRPQQKEIFCKCQGKCTTNNTCQCIKASRRCNKKCNCHSKKNPSSN